MLGSIYIGMSGMTSYSRGLDLISNNVANLNTPGFKVGESVFGDLLYRNGSGAIDGSGGASIGGAGVSVDTSRQDFSEGQMQQTGNPLDAAVDGDGFFVLQRDDGLVFTRAGQFEFDKDGNLVEHTTQAKVLVSTASSAATTFNQSGYRVSPPKATTEVDLAGSLTQTGTNTFDLTNIDVIDTSGAQQVLEAKFTRDDTDPLTWNVNVLSSDGTVLGSGTVAFSADGTPADGKNQLSVSVTPAGLPAFSVSFNIGTAGSFAGVTSLASSTQSTVSVTKQDGLTLGTLSQVSFDDRGRITLAYSNGQTLTPATLLLAQFSAPNELQSLGGSLFSTADSRDANMADPQSGGRGRIVGGSLEMSNVNLTQQFSDLIILQRGYQASSQMTSVANEMIQQLLAMGQQK